MKTIVLVRHATAVAGGPKTDDFSRSLRKKGRKEARAMASWYRQVGGDVDHMMSSPALRALETARLFGRELGLPAKNIIQKKKLYSALDPSDLLKVVHGIDERHATVMFFGHDPSFSEFAQFLVKGFNADLPKCAIFAVQFKRKVWRTVRPGEGHLLCFEYPQRLKTLLSQEQQLRGGVSSRIEEAIVEVLDELGIDCGQENLRRIRQASERLGRKLRLMTDRATPLKNKTSRRVQPKSKTASRKGKTG